MILARSKEAVDFALRLAFFAIAPFLIVFAAELFPMTGALVQIGLAVAVFFLAEVVRKLVPRFHRIDGCFARAAPPRIAALDCFSWAPPRPEIRSANFLVHRFDRNDALARRSKVVDLAFSGLLQFETYYRSHPPRPLLYYVFYPLLFPYWITVTEARQEFLLFKGYTAVSFLFLLASLVFQYWSAFPPELSVGDFLPIAGGTLLAETVVVLMFLMPIVTSVVHFHMNRAPRRLVFLLLAGALSVGVAAARIERRRDPIVSYATRRRVRLRSDANLSRANQAMTSALLEAWTALPAARSDIDSDGKVEGTPLEKARTALVQFYNPTRRTRSTSGIRERPGER